MRKLTYFKRYNTLKVAKGVANRVNGAFSDGDAMGYKSGYVVYKVGGKKPRGFKSKYVRY